MVRSQFVMLLVPRCLAYGTVHSAMAGFSRLGLGF